MKYKLDKYQGATAIAIFFHAIGLVGILFFDTGFFIKATAFNLLLSFALIVWTQEKVNLAFVAFLFIVFFVGFFAEVTGVNTALLFGEYTYGNVLGVKWMNVPLIIGVNWIIVIYCCGISTHTLLQKTINKLATVSQSPPVNLKALSVIVDGATLAVAFDWLMEPVAVKLGFWKWAGDGEIPMYNYLCWIIVSLALLCVFQFLPFKKHNKFAVNLLLIQGMFFLILRSFLT